MRRCDVQRAFEYAHEQALLCYFSSQRLTSEPTHLDLVRQTDDKRLDTDATEASAPAYRRPAPSLTSAGKRILQQPAQLGDVEVRLSGTTGADRALG